MKKLFLKSFFHKCYYRPYSILNILEFKNINLIYIGGYTPLSPCSFFFLLAIKRKKISYVCDACQGKNPPNPLFNKADIIIIRSFWGVTIFSQGCRVCLKDLLLQMLLQLLLKSWVTQALTNNNCFKPV